MSTIKDIITHCPKCGTLHLDVAEWRDRPHKTHLCANCGELWAPSEGHTRGVAPSAEDLELLSLIKNYRAAYFANYADQMCSRRALERARSAYEGEDFWEWWENRSGQDDNDAESRRLYIEMKDAEVALTEESTWPMDYVALVNEMKQEFGDG